MLQTPKLKLAIFDCDGTIVDSRTLIVEAMRRSFNDVGLDIPTDRAIMNLVGLPLRTVLTKLRDDEKDVEGIDMLTARYREHFVLLHDSETWRPPLYPGTLEMLHSIVNTHGCLLGIATGKSRRGLIRTLEQSKIASIFATTWTADDGPGKPNPTILEEAMAEVGAEPNECVMVGDTTFDIELGRNAGMLTVGVPWGNHTRKHISSSYPDVLVDSWDQFEEWLGRCFPAPRA